MASLWAFLHVAIFQAGCMGAARRSCPKRIFSKFIIFKSTPVKFLMYFAKQCQISTIVEHLFCWRHHMIAKKHHIFSTSIFMLKKSIIPNALILGCILNSTVAISKMLSKTAWPDSRNLGFNMKVNKCIEFFCFCASMRILQAFKSQHEPRAA